MDEPGFCHPEHEVALQVNLLGRIVSYPGTAAWVQAVGSILALIVAILVPRLTAAATDRCSRRRFLSSVASICDEVYSCFDHAAGRCAAGPDEGLKFVRSVQAFHRFRIVSCAVRAIPLHRLPTYEVTRSVLELQAMMAEGLMQLDAAFREIDDHQRLVQAEAYGAAFSELAGRARPYLAQIRAVLAKV